ncbi:hypothetical protein CAPTEDRAFT_167098 [Capitella teleta]|uniref:Flavin-containing monooxygenase n=1 Tax=Capitella teleta TaxID=283909 RepID=R7TXA6_CAPTE|nr:hypothetical protein CAPTEDRAFT_167098 [Capitella teleta]|eukprot:ELT98324.1 hypothetical protein CAPTEDRAFT_167098 [Capitella teleta]
MPRVNAVAVIGAGASGLASIKSCLEEGLNPVCFEREDDIGGLWNYTEDPRPGKGSVYKSCIINTSKEMMAFSDFPVPTDFPPFMPHGFVLEYFRLYARHFDLLKHIRFGCSIEAVNRADDYEETGRYVLTIRRTEDDQSAGVEELTVDGVMVCSGHHVYPHIPELSGASAFKGMKLHSHDYKIPGPFEDMNVLVVGAGNSAVDIAVDLSRTTKKVFLSTRRGAWVISRMGPLGIPADALCNSRAFFSLPLSVLQTLVKLMANFRFSHRNYGLQPTHAPLQAHPTINDELPHRIMTGAVQVRDDVAAFGAHDVTFKDGGHEEIDAVIFATGYDYKFKFLDDDILSMDNNKPGTGLYRFMMPAHLRHPTLSVIGLVQAIGSVIPISEMQARWHARLLTGGASLPEKAEMDSDIEEKSSRMKEQYVDSQRHTLQTFWIEYMDTIAEEIGVRPNLGRLALSDPWLSLRCFLGACVPSQYRLEGPGRWSGARDAILRSLSNNAKATQSRVLHDEPQGLQLSALLWLLIAVFLAVLFVWR